MDSSLFLSGLLNLVILGAYLAASCVLLRKREAGPWLMLAGTVLLFISYILSTWMFYQFRNGEMGQLQLFMATHAGNVGSLGSLLFIAGLTIVAFKHRRLHARLEELESILAAQSQMIDSNPQQPRPARPDVV